MCYPEHNPGLTLSPEEVACSHKVLGEASLVARLWRAPLVTREVSGRSERKHSDDYTSWHPFEHAYVHARSLPRRRLVVVALACFSEMVLHLAAIVSIWLCNASCLPWTSASKASGYLL
jgi:hypothetical protein